MLEDERGPPPAEREAQLEDDDILYDDIPPPTPTSTVLAPAAATAATTSLPSMPIRTHVQQSRWNKHKLRHISTINVHIDSPTNTTNQAVQYHQRFGSIPKTPARQGCRTLTSKRIRDLSTAAQYERIQPPEHQESQAEQQAIADMPQQAQQEGQLDLVSQDTFLDPTDIPEPLHDPPPQQQQHTHTHPIHQHNQFHQKNYESTSTAIVM